MSELTKFGDGMVASRGRRMRWRVAAFEAMGAFSSLIACANGPTGAESAVCKNLQEIVMSIDRSDKSGALQRFLELQHLTDRSGNERMRREGAALFEYLGEPVEGYEQMTVRETVDFANKALEQASSHLDAIADECARVGAEIELPEGGLRR